MYMYMYVGETSQPLRSNHRNRIKQLCQLYLYHHFSSDGHTLEDVSKMPIITVVSKRLQRKEYWCRELPYSGYFSGGKIFVVFVVERRTTKFLLTKQYRIVPGCGLVYCKIFPRTGQKFTSHENFMP